jgi:metallo-beta-lactamase family protein
VLLVESTYGDRTHEKDDGGKILAGIINETVRRNGKVVIPAFALGRVEELLYWLSLLEERREIPELPVYVDSPMASSVLAEYRRRLDELDPDVSRYAVSKGEHAASERRAIAFATAKLTVLSSIGESREVQESGHPSIVISSSGMATGGRVLHHLARVLPDPRNTVLFSGYQSVGTRGRSLRDGARTVKIHGQEVPVRAEVAALESMSAHADANEILRWLRNFRQPPAVTFLVHGEPAAMDTLRARIERELGWTVRTPEHGEKAAI